jgi:hypothetical protein
MAHIQSCARKQLLSKETLRVLLLQEIENVPLGNVTTKGKGKEIETPRTFLADILDDAVSRKKVKRSSVAKTIRDVMETRDVILDKARAILGPLPSKEDDSHNRTLIFGPSKFIGNFAMDTMPQTQPFGESALRQKQTRFTSGWLATGPPLHYQNDSDSKDTETMVPVESPGPSASYS